MDRIEELVQEIITMKDEYTPATHKDIEQGLDKVLHKHELEDKINRIIALLMALILVCLFILFSLYNLAE